MTAGPQLQSLPATCLMSFSRCGSIMTVRACQRMLRLPFDGIAPSTAVSSWSVQGKAIHADSWLYGCRYVRQCSQTAAVWQVPCWQRCAAMSRRTSCCHSALQQPRHLLHMLRSQRMQQASAAGCAAQPTAAGKRGGMLAKAVMPKQWKWHSACHRSLKLPAQRRMPRRRQTPAPASTA